MDLINSAYEIGKNIEATLQSDADLTVFLLERYPSKRLSTLLGFRKRTDIRGEGCPFFMITRPEITTENRPGMRGRLRHTFFIYFFVYQPNEAKAFEEMVKLEELIDQTLLKDTSRGGHAVDTITGESANDEGYFSPIYAGVKKITVVQEVNQSAR